MTKLRRAERMDRVERDTGDAEDNVVIARGTHLSSEAYHDPDVDCRNRDQISNPDTVTREKAQQMWRYPCKRCVLEGNA